MGADVVRQLDAAIEAAVLIAARDVSAVEDHVAHRVVRHDFGEFRGHGLGAGEAEHDQLTDLLPVRHGRHKLPQLHLLRHRAGRGDWRWRRRIRRRRRVRGHSRRHCGGLRRKQRRGGRTAPFGGQRGERPPCLGGFSGNIRDLAVCPSLRPTADQQKEQTA